MNRQRLVLTTAAVIGLIPAAAVVRAVVQPDQPPSGVVEVQAGPLPEPDRKQLRLQNFDTWLAGLPDVANRGYIASVDDTAKLAVTLLWCGQPDTSLRRQIQGEAGRRGITTTFKQRKYSVAQL